MFDYKPNPADDANARNGRRLWRLIALLIAFALVTPLALLR